MHFLEKCVCKSFAKTQTLFHHTNYIKDDFYSPGKSRTGSLIDSCPETITQYYQYYTSDQEILKAHFQDPGFSTSSNCTDYSSSRQ